MLSFKPISLITLLQSLCSQVLLYQILTAYMSLKPLLGASTALLGKEGAMACTVAVEESISEHYNSQIRALMEKDPERYTELLNVSQPLLVAYITAFELRQ